MVVESATEAWGTHQRLHVSRKLTLPAPAAINSPELLGAEGPRGPSLLIAGILAWPNLVQTPTAALG